MNDYEKEIPMAKCPQCGTEYDDYDGVGVSYCPACGYCKHLVIYHGRCVECGEIVKRERTLNGPWPNAE